jgi:hypothetical protein
MPLADHSGLVTRFLKQFRERLLSTIELVAIATETVDVRVLASLNYRPHWPTNTVGHVTSVKTNALPSNSIDVGRLIYF